MINDVAKAIRLLRTAGACIVVAHPAKLRGIVDNAALVRAVLAREYACILFDAHCPRPVAVEVFQVLYRSGAIEYEGKSSVPVSQGMKFVRSP